MGFPRGGELIRDADMKLLLAEREPHSASVTERLWLVELAQAEELSEEVSGGRLAARRRGELHMIEPEHVHGTRQF
jgi:hypothetical protein